jgi:hypothetical protein
MRKVILIIIALSLLVTLALALTACPRTTELEPGQGEVTSQGRMPPVGERETDVPAEGPATTAEEMEALEGAEAGEPEGEEEAAPDEEEGDADESGDEEAEEPEDTEEEPTE